MTDKVVLTMPPSPTWYAGREAVRVHMERMFSGQVRQRWRLQPTRANNQIAFACYRFEESDGLYHAHMLHLPAFEGEQITVMHLFFLPPIFPRFGMAPVL